MGIIFKSKWTYEDGSRKSSEVRLINGLYDCTCAEFKASGYTICKHIRQVAEENLFIENEVVRELPNKQTLIREACDYAREQHELREVWWKAHLEREYVARNGPRKVSVQSREEAA